MERRLDEWRWLLHQVRQGVEAQQLAHWKKYPKKYRVELKAAGVAEEGAESPLPAIGHQGDLPLA
ncbi:MAG: hypothetical protein GKR89_31160 [Candidatus Latescibacteria bacterium]|nr:hypothetical protein [Candidatus Latescibacterota bacterium]